MIKFNDMDWIKKIGSEAKRHLYPTLTCDRLHYILVISVTCEIIMLYWIFVRGICEWPVDSPHNKGSVMQSFKFCLLLLLVIWDAIMLMWHYCNNLPVIVNEVTQYQYCLGLYLFGTCNSNNNFKRYMTHIEMFQIIQSLTHWSIQTDNTHTLH